VGHRARRWTQEAAGEAKEVISPCSPALQGIRLRPLCNPGATEIQAGGNERWLLSRQVSGPPSPPTLCCLLAT
jgi:hypothetical protein